MDLNKFFTTTKNFTKKFYKIRGERSSEEDKENVAALIKICAIAVSRDLVYKIYWDMERRGVVTDLLEPNVPDHHIPREENDKNLLYPLADDVEENWMAYCDYENCFERNDFIAVDRIEDM